MTEQLAEALRARLAALDLFDRLVGLARLYQTQVGDGDELKTVRYPVPLEFTAVDCERDSRYLVPDITTASIVFFEDGGTIPYSVATNIRGYRSTLRLLAWLNPAFFEEPVTDADLTLLIDKALRTPAVGTSAFIDLQVTWASLPAEAALWGRYTIDTPMLYAPYRLLGLELTCTYRYRACVPVKTEPVLPLTLLPCVLPSVFVSKS